MLGASNAEVARLVTLIVNKKNAMAKVSFLSRIIFALQIAKVLPKLIKQVQSPKFPLAEKKCNRQSFQVQKNESFPLLWQKKMNQSPKVVSAKIKCLPFTEEAIGFHFLHCLARKWRKMEHGGDPWATTKLRFQLSLCDEGPISRSPGA